MTRLECSGLILASRSPRRAELLRSAGIRFELVPADVDEEVPQDASPGDASLFAARAKSRAVAERYPRFVVLGADTVVSVGDRILGKPRDADDARRILRLLSGKWHAVWTGLCFCHVVERWEFTDVVSSSVKFRDLSAQDIEQYVATAEPLDKAGAYGIQGGARLFVERLEGSLDNVIGLPTETVVEILDRYYPELLKKRSRTRR